MIIDTNNYVTPIREMVASLRLKKEPSQELRYTVEYIDHIPVSIHVMSGDFEMLDIMKRVGFRA